MRCGPWPAKANAKIQEVWIGALKEFERMNEFDIGTATLSRVEVDEEPPGSPCQSHSCHSHSSVQQRLWPLTLPEPRAPGSPGLRDFSAPADHSPRRCSPPVLPAAPRARAFRRAFYRDVTDKQWNDWRWQARTRIRTREQIEKMLDALRRRA